MAPPDPLKPTVDRVTRIQNVLMDLLRNVLGKIKPIMKTFTDFMRQVQSSAKELAAKVGKSTVNKLIGYARSLESIFPTIEKAVREALKMAQKILATIKKATDPTKIFNVVKKLAARLASLFRKIVSMIAGVLDALNPIDIALSVINSLVTVLRLVLSWITSVTGAASAVKKTKKLMKQTVKTLKSELRTVTELVKETAALKPA